MSNVYEGLTAKEADDVLRGRIGSIICDTLAEARGMGRKAWDDRDIFNWSYQVSGMIAVSIEIRRRDGPTT
ncbi:hypothetical protein [Ensifer sp. OV372]|uniref:hypothetical protein n=1 Tax=Ensifer sp. OV372 TaxID=1855293 RepID=UPI0008E1FB26|nr:hypothetical protein [Ensifer sp. OV372]SFH22882.1 hypothetical protein SAMN05216459_1213 [Ensifer sp. OV372]